MESLNQYKPQPFRANLFQPTSPPRVSTDPEAGPKRSHLRHGLHHHHHRHNHHHYDGSRRRDAKEAVQSAIQLHPPASFGDLLKQASRSSRSSPDGSRRESKVVANGATNSGEGDVYIMAHKPVRPEDVKREQARVKARENELRASLQGLSEQSLKTSRRLDDTYYSILEKVAVLRQTIGSLQELSALTQELHEQFQSDTTALTEDIQGQFEGFNKFETHQEQVEALEQRITAGRDKANALTTRLAEARSKVDARAQLEAENEARTSRRLRVLWGILGTILGLCVIAILIHQLKPIHATSHGHSLDFSSREELFEAPIPEAAKEALFQTFPSTSSPRETLLPKSAPDLDEDPRLRLFDEL
ncbi:hypothetical protein BDV96DRAFT_488467 [Lophiotrema nucula]|uniref:Uncharacterized protein n=1 Tax=Lophiotrema nucula TaxID=690887 RepID=A0A6A5ZIR6_9PLEO|nr:hypothetical protein BDV96DRAFT_488467 [Lophiotrema nucula]